MPRPRDGGGSIRGRSVSWERNRLDEAHTYYPESWDALKCHVSVLGDAAHDTPQDPMQLQTLKLVPEYKEQVAQFPQLLKPHMVQHRDVSRSDHDRRRVSLSRCRSRSGRKMERGSSPVRGKFGRSEGP